MGEVGWSEGSRRWGLDCAAAAAAAAAAVAAVAAWLTSPLKPDRRLHEHFLPLVLVLLRA